MSDARESLDCIISSPLPRHTHPLTPSGEEGLRNIELVYGRVGESISCRPASEKDHLEPAWRQLPPVGVQRPLINQGPRELYT